VTRQRPRAIDALFVGYEEQENLGLRSIIATLEVHGFRSALVPYITGDPSRVLAAVRDYSPGLVGFSIIFQYTLNGFADLMAELRNAGIQAHFTAGGHFPSLKPRETLDAIPALDSVVCFEGELTTLELLKHLDQADRWAIIEGLAFRRDGEVVVNPARPLVADLNTLSPPIRSAPRTMSRGIRVASLLASRGCLYNCSFCSVRQFYGGPRGSLRRVRAPEAVASEMKTLYERDGVRFFIFQDDDFAARSRKQREWVESFLEALDGKELADRIAWKISCRVDDVERELFARCRDHGLIAVYLGVESGNTIGLRIMNKLVTVKQNLAAINTLKGLDIAFDIGFMLFDPDSTFETIKKNIAFLRQVAGDGPFPVNFCKMLPYAGTPIEARLCREGRLKGTISRPDYDFTDPRLDLYAFYVSKVFNFRNFDRLGLVERLRIAIFDSVLARTIEPVQWVEEYETALRDLTARANAVALDTLEDGLRFFAARNVDGAINDWSDLGPLAEREWRSEVMFQCELDRIIETYNPRMLKAYVKIFNSRFGDRCTY
jgi:anaerobic magnesium-protoporphyrin IX monomethyl ester cyclase